MDTVLDEQWEQFLAGEEINKEEEETLCNEDELNKKCKELYISTKTKITYLENEVDLENLFWKLPILDYVSQNNGIIKKQMKFTCNTKEEFEEFEKIKNKQKNVEIVTINNIDDPNGHIKFKYVCKVNIGLCKKDVISYKTKKRGAFYNCFVCIMRVFFEGEYKEVNIKIFNTGRMSFPGMLSDKLMYKSLSILMDIFKDNGYETNYVKNRVETVLINSNFNCGFYINRNNLNDILKKNYKLNVSYDPCSYPGIQCKYMIEQYKVSFMIFRTGSVLIVGKCSEEILYKVYNFIKKILISEYKNIVSISKIQEKEKKRHVTKVKRKIIYITG